MTIYITLSVLLLTLVALFNLSSPATAVVTGVETEKPKHEPYKAVHKFCGKRRSKRDQEFCLRVLKSDPRSATAKTNVALLFISLDLTLSKTNRTKHFLQSTLSKNGPTNGIEISSNSPPPLPRPLKTALKECISGYDWGIGELKMIPAEYKADPGTVSYDALMALDAMQSCQDSLDRNNITYLPILRRHRSATAYVVLVVDISRTIVD